MVLKSMVLKSMVPKGWFFNEDTIILKQKILLHFRGPLLGKFVDISIQILKSNFQGKEVHKLLEKTFKLKIVCVIFSETHLSSLHCVF